tara:strand:+ start:7080 stop:7466 length:387 start_codon:yes stop_codon:yes gene_type:complete
MFSFIKYSNPKGKNIYDIRFPLSEKDKIINDNDLSFKFHEKVYFLNNVIIKINPDGIFFNYENDISIHVNDQFIVREYETLVCPKFSFYKSDVEEEYKLYENGDSSIKLKEYNDYYTFEMISSNGLKI